MASHTPPPDPAARLFILVFAVLLLYYLLIRIPLFPDELLGLSFKKLAKLFAGFSFVIGGWWVYRKHRRTP